MKEKIEKLKQLWYNVDEWIETIDEVETEQLDEEQEENVDDFSDNDYEENETTPNDDEDYDEYWQDDEDEDEEELGECFAEDEISLDELDKDLDVLIASQEKSLQKNSSKKDDRNTDKIKLYEEKNNLVEDEKRDIYYIDCKEPKFIDDVVQEIKGTKLWNTPEKIEFTHTEKGDENIQHFLSLTQQEQDKLLLDRMLKRWKNVVATKEKHKITNTKKNETILSLLKINHYTQLDYFLYLFLFNVFLTDESYKKVKNWVLSLPKESVPQFYPIDAYNSKLERKLKDKLRSLWVLNNDDFDAWKENKFIRNISNQSQLSLNVAKSLFFDIDWNELPKEDFRNFINGLPKTIKLFIYNLSYNKSNNFLRTIFFDDLKKIHPKLKNIYNKAKEMNFLEKEVFNKRIVFLEFIDGTLYFFTPFGVSWNTGDFLECFKTTINSESLLKQYYKISWFKLLFSDVGKENNIDFKANELREIYSESSGDIYLLDSK